MRAATRQREAGVARASGVEREHRGGIAGGVGDLAHHDTATGRAIAEVHAVVDGGAASQGDVRRAAVAIHRDATNQSRSGVHSRGCVHHDGVVARIQIQELVGTIGICGRRGEVGAARIAEASLQMHDDAGDARLKRVLDTVAVEVVPDEVADDARSLEAEINRQVGGVVGAEDDLATVDVAVDGAVAAHVGGGERVSAGGRDRDDVGAGTQAGEAVVAVGVGEDTLAPTGRPHLGQGDLDAGNAGFTGRLETVAVQVLPDPVANDARAGTAIGHAPERHVLEVRRDEVAIGVERRLKREAAQRGVPEEDIRTGPGIADIFLADHDATARALNDRRRLEKGIGRGRSAKELSGQNGLVGNDVEVFGVHRDRGTVELGEKGVVHQGAERGSEGKGAAGWVHREDAAVATVERGRTDPVLVTREDTAREWPVDGRVVRKGNHPFKRSGHTRDQRRDTRGGHTPDAAGAGHDHEVAAHCAVPILVEAADVPGFARKDNPGIGDGRAPGDHLHDLAWRAVAGKDLVEREAAHAGARLDRRQLDLARQTSQRTERRDRAGRRIDQREVARGAAGAVDADQHGVGWLIPVDPYGSGDS